MTDPKILRTERDGSLTPAQIRIVGGCAMCRTPIMNSDVYCKDNQGSVFCDLECAAAFYGVSVVEPD